MANSISRRAFLRGTTATAVALSSPACVAWFARWYDSKRFFDMGRKREDWGDLGPPVGRTVDVGYTRPSAQLTDDSQGFIYYSSNGPVKVEAFKPGESIEVHLPPGEGQIPVGFGVQRLVITGVNHVTGTIRHA